MTTLTFRTPYPAPPHRLSRALNAVASALATMLDVFAEAADQSAAARNRFPSAD
jgi:hypothetical protein